MLEERRRQIMAELRRQGSATLAELAGLLRVSTMTVRRDLDALAEQGLLTRIRGGAILEESPARENTGRSRPPREASPVKDAVARTAATLVEPGSVVGLAAGTTTLLVASHLAEVEDLTVVTNSLPIAEVLDRRPSRPEPLPQHSVVLTGGLRTASDALVGPVAIRALEDLHCDLAILSGAGLAPETGLTTPNLLEAETNRALVASARRTVVVIDHTKWWQVSLRTAVDLDAVDVLVIDDGAGPETLAELRRLVPEVLVAPLRSERSDR